MFPSNPVTRSDRVTKSVLAKTHLSCISVVVINCFVFVFFFGGRNKTFHVLVEINGELVKPCQYIPSRIERTYLMVGLGVKTFSAITVSSMTCRG